MMFPSKMNQNLSGWESNKTDSQLITTECDSNLILGATPNLTNNNIINKSFNLSRNPVSSLTLKMTVIIFYERNVNSANSNLSGNISVKFGEKEQNFTPNSTIINKNNGLQNCVPNEDRSETQISITSSSFSSNIVDFRVSVINFDLMISLAIKSFEISAKVGCPLYSEKNSSFTVNNCSCKNKFYQRERQYSSLNGVCAIKDWFSGIFKKECLLCSRFCNICNSDTSCNSCETNFVIRSNVCQLANGNIIFLCLIYTQIKFNIHSNKKLIKQTPCFIKYLPYSSFLKNSVN
jgi:hypothetical protein